MHRGGTDDGVCVPDVNVPPLALQAQHAAAPCIKKKERKKGKVRVRPAGRPARSPPPAPDASKGHDMRRVRRGRAITWSQLAHPPAASAKQTHDIAVHDEGRGGSQSHRSIDRARRTRTGDRKETQRTNDSDAHASHTGARGANGTTRSSVRRSLGLVLHLPPAAGRWALAVRVQ